MIKSTFFLATIISSSILNHNPQNENTRVAVVGIPLSSKEKPTATPISFWDLKESDLSKISDDDLKNALPDGFKNKKQRIEIINSLKYINEHAKIKALMFLLTEKDIKSAIKIDDESFEFYMTNEINDKRLPFRLKKYYTKNENPKYVLSPAEKATQSEFYECNEYGPFYQAKNYTKESVFYGKSEIARIYTCYGLFISDEKPDIDKNCLKIMPSKCFHRTSPRAMWYILNEQNESFFGLSSSKEKD